MKNSAKKLIMVLVLALIAQMGFATTYTTVQDGAWNSSSTWDANGIPPVVWSNGNYININHKVTIAAGTSDAIHHYVTTISSKGEISGASSKIIIRADGSEIINNGKIDIKEFEIGPENVTVENYGIILVSDDMLVKSGLLKNHASTSTTSPYIEVNNLTLENDASLENKNIFKVNNDMHSKGPNKSNSGNLSIGNDLTIEWHDDAIINTGHIAVGGTITGNVDNSGGGTLPIELISFEVQKVANSVGLSWITATEENNEFFTIERSQDGQNWEEIAIIPGAGNSNELLQYSFIDQSPLEGQAYYHLKQTDFDGTSTYSEVRVVKLEDNMDNKIKVYPNPTQGQIQMDVKQVDIREIYVLNIIGQDVTNSVSISNNGDSSFIIDLTSLPKGMYFIQTPNATTKIYKQ